MNQDWQPESVTEFVMKQAIDDVPDQARTYLRDGKCWHPMSLRIGHRCVGCGEKFDKS